MILTEYIDVSVEKRNLAKIRSILGDSVQRNTVVRVYRKDFYKLRTPTIILILCDQCGTFHTRKLNCLIEKQPDESIQLCNPCVYAAAAEKMRQTVRTESNRKLKSERVKNFYKTPAGLSAKESCREKRKEWFSTPAGIANKIQSAKNLPRMYGKDHPNFNPNKDEYAIYRMLVLEETKLHDISTLKNSDKPRGLCGTKGAYQLDHIVSVKFGFDNNIPPEIIGHIANLQFIPWEENSKKRHHVDIDDLNRLLKLFDFALDCSNDVVK